MLQEIVGKYNMNKEDLEGKRRGFFSFPILN